MAFRRFPVPPGTEALAREGFRSDSEDIRSTQEFKWPRGDGLTPLGRPVVGSGPGLPPIIPRGADAASVRSLAPPWREKLGPVSRDFNEQNFELIVAAGVGSFVDGPTFRLPSGNVGWLQQMQQYVLSQTAGTSLIWQLQFNGAPVNGFNNKRNPPGTANLVLIDLNELQIRVPSGALINVRVTNQNINGPWTVGIGYAGWHHPLQAELDSWGPV